MRLFAESEGQPIFDANTSQQEEIDKEKLRNSIVQELSQGKPVALSFDLDENTSPESTVFPFYGEFMNYLTSRGFDPDIIYTNYPKTNGNIGKPMLLIKPRR